MGFFQHDAVLGDEVVVAGRAVGLFGVGTNRSTGIEDLVRKSTRDGTAGVQKLRQSNDVTGKQKQSLVNVKGFP